MEIIPSLTVQKVADILMLVKIYLIYIIGMQHKNEFQSLLAVSKRNFCSFVVEFNVSQFLFIRTERYFVSRRCYFEASYFCVTVLLNVTAAVLAPVSGLLHERPYLFAFLEVNICQFLFL